MDAKGYEAGLGFSFPKFPSEVSYESLHSHTLKVNEDYQGVLKGTTAILKTLFHRAKNIFDVVILQFVCRSF
jgi:hypothetical protein